ncbi:rhamnulokinase [Scopulibacillus cellulosilyticus]|uniref:Rhamnulokinase family protein n=1 Tax=Scopulibacillus cellulosilyticus TaxID=2665665 RepID=A0ABW2Q251_9BACL
MGSKAAWRGLAIDLGASSGRVLSGRFYGSRLCINEVHRFENGPVNVQETLYWDILKLFQEVKYGLGLASRTDREIHSLGIDSWAVDYGLLDRNGQLLSYPVHYRDHRTEGIMEDIFDKVNRDDVFYETGIQFLSFNTIFQLLAEKNINNDRLVQADKLLMIPDLLHYFLTNEKVTEFTNATTTQIFNPTEGAWSRKLIEQFDFPEHIFPSIVQPGTNLGKMMPSVSDELGGMDLDVIAVASHDTGSAVAAVPAASQKFAYLSCGTWSLLGTEVNKPVLTERALALNFTNEGGAEGTFRLLKNVMGLWLLQELKREWERLGHSLSWTEITKMTEASAPFISYVDPDDPLFLAPGDMTSRIRNYCLKTGQSVPESNGAFLRCVTESLVLKYRWVLERLEELTGDKLEVLHMVGGGIQNELLCQWTANACGRPVLAGPIEASGIGNLMIQMIAAGELSSLAEGRQLIKQSFPVKTYYPKDKEKWDEAYATFEGLIRQI